MIRTLIACLAAATTICALTGCDSKSQDPGVDLANVSGSAPTPGETAAQPPAPAAQPQDGPVQGTVTGDPNKKFDFKTPHVQKGDVAVIETNLGTIKFTFFDAKAPHHVANFEKLADAGFYDGVKFHRVIPGFMIQTGDPNSKGADRSTYGMGGSPSPVKAEFNDVSFDRGIVGMARSQDPDSASSQFFIMVAPNPSLNNHYTAFGKVTEGMDVADKIVNVKRDERDDPLPPNEIVVKSIKIVHPGAK